MPESRIRSVRELRCGVWEVDIIDASRKRLRRRFRAESADGARAAALASLPGPKACTLGEALDRYFEIIAVKGTTKKTIAHYRKECSALGAIAGCAVDSISPAAAAAALESAESRGVSRVRCYRLKTICAAAGRHALAEGLCASNPFSEVPFDVPRPPRKKRPISPAGLKAARALGASGSGHSAAAIGLALGCGLHRLRHTFATELIMSGVNPKTVSSWLGHTDPSFTLRIYVSSSPENLRASVDAVNEVMALPEGYAGQGSELPARIRGDEKKEEAEEPAPDPKAPRPVKIISWESLACG